MGNISIEKIETMLRVYRDRLAQAETQPIDYASCMRFSAKISLLEDLYFIAHQEAAQQSVQPTCPKAEALRNAEALEDIARQLDESR
jgi:hypothetical protein